MIKYNKYNGIQNFRQFCILGEFRVYVVIPRIRYQQVDIRNSGYREQECSNWRSHSLPQLCRGSGPAACHQ